MSEELITIGLFSLLTGLSVPALRHYDELGLLKPADTDPRTGYRRYRHGQVKPGRRIRALRRIDVPLEDIRRVLEGEETELRMVLENHRTRLEEQARAFDDKVEIVDSYLKEGIDTQGGTDVRLATINLGVRSQQELEAACTFWSSVFGADFEDWSGYGSQQMRLGPDEDFFIFNIRVRSQDEPHYGHNAAFGLAVGDLHDFHRRALAAGAKEHFPPTESEHMPRHPRFEDPVGNRIVVFQREIPDGS